MSERTERSDLVKTSGSNLNIKDPSHDLIDKDVYDHNGEQIGAVEELYLDEQTSEVRFLRVGAGGFLGIGERYFLIPHEAVDGVIGSRVILVQEREKVTGSPDYDSADPPTPDQQRELYDYYDYTYPQARGAERDLPGTEEQRPSDPRGPTV